MVERYGNGALDLTEYTRNCILCATVSKLAKCNYIVRVELMEQQPINIKPLLADYT